ncbi:MAG: carboxypeptidase regulatory-like domain-containing protein [Myxococcales bacterium]|nr:carboxypeptidase regulatory-like domain-containing protein [Myxococcales bacterium]
MSKPIERAGGLAILALAAVGVWTQCAPSSAPDDVSVHPRLASGRSWRAPSFHGVDGGFDELGDGGTDEGDERFEDERELCWTVRVIDTDGLPAAALVVVSVANLEDEIPALPHEVRVGWSGEGEVCTLSFRSVWVDAWTDEGDWGRTSAFIDSDDGEEPMPPVQVVVYAQALVRGRVVDGDGAPVPGAQLDVAQSTGPGTGCTSWNHTEDVTGREQWLTDADGAFTIPVGAMGFYQLCARKEHHIAAASEPFAIRPGASVDLRLTMPVSVAMSGVVVHDGEPIIEARVRVAGPGIAEMVDTEGGRFEVQGLRPDVPAEVEVWAPGFAARRLTLLPGEHRIELDRGSVLEVSVALPPRFVRCVGPPTAPPGSDPLEVVRHLAFTRSDVVVEARREGWDATMPADESRMARFEDVPSGRLHIRAWAHQLPGTAEVEVSPGPTPTRVTVPIEDDPSLGLVRLVVDTGSMLERPVVLSSDGPGGGVIRYVLPNRPECRFLTPGSYRIQATLDQLRAVTTVDLAAGATVERTLVLAPDPELETTPPEIEEWLAQCDPPFDTIRMEGRRFVSDAEPGSGLLPGDELLDVDDEARFGPRDEPFEVTVRRPDGSTSALSIPRTRCDPIIR